MKSFVSPLGRVNLLPMPFVRYRNTDLNRKRMKKRTTVCLILVEERQILILEFGVKRA
ncbi:hypothetical protein KEH51_23790 [[Brevibacterium] frigoritolerans]|uniref:Uncharacterized protein n=1 Tax=Peribacillus frigoritolerans TaxID=450367 RepID=A0A941FSB3_9BACI|nr:hypothetical protein [Peribacillus frigoritolerans]